MTNTITVAKIFKDGSMLNKLKEYGIELDILQRVIKIGVSNSKMCTSHDIPSRKGYTQYADITRYLRDYLIPKGWLQCDYKNFSKIVTPNKKIAIVVSSGDAAVGKDYSPTTKNPKGNLTDVSTKINSKQLSLLEDTDFEILTPISNYNVEKVLFLLIYGDDDLKEIRSELSEPMQIENNGYISKWNERIILPTIPTELTEPTPIPKFNDEDDILVQRKV